MEIFLVLGLILLNAIFAMSEMSLVSAKKVRLQQLMDKGSIGAAKALVLQENPTRLFSTLQVGITSIGILSGIVGEKSLVEPISIFLQNFLGITVSLSQTLSSVGVIIFLTFMSVVFGEIIPKQLGIALPERIASIISIPMSWLSKIALPIVYIFSKSSHFFLKLLRLDNIQQSSVSNEEIKELMVQGAESGVFHASEGQLVANILKMDETKVENIMTHRGEFFYIDITKDFKENIDKLVNGSFSRVIIVKENIDNIIGILHMTDILTKIQKNEIINFEEYMKSPLYLPETVTATQVLESFKRKKVESAIIVNEYGENIGIVTLVDIMEAIVGDVASDNGEEDPEVVIREDGSYLIDGLITLDRLARALEIDEEDMDISENIATLSGVVMEKANEIPNVGFNFTLKADNFELDIEVVDMDKNCVDKVLVTKRKIIEVKNIEEI